MESLQISDYMNVRPVKLKAAMTVAEAVELLLQSRQTGGPVIDAHNKVIGFLSEQDCIERMLESSYFREQVCHVDEIMQTNVLSVKPYMSVLEMAQQMLREKPKVYPVVDDDQYLVGCISRSDVLRAFDDQLLSGYKRAG